MARLKDNRTIPDLVLDNTSNQQSFESFNGLNLNIENYICFGVIPENERVQSLKVLFGNGAMVLIQYSRMMSPITFNGANEIKLNTPTLQLIIKGSNLEPLMEFIGEQRLAWVCSSDVDSMTDSMMMQQGEPEIITIQIHSKTKQSKASS